VEGAECATLLEEAGRGDLLAWRLQWLRILLSTTLALAEGEHRGKPGGLEELADQFWQAHRHLPACFPRAFWQDLLDYLLPPPAEFHAPIVPPDSLPRCRVLFPLVLSEPIVDGGSETGVLLAEFVLETLLRRTGSVFLHPEQALWRCLGDSFAQAFAQAAQAAQRPFGEERTALPDVRVRIQTPRPGHERFLLGTVLRGTSGAGALAVALDHLYHRRGPVDTHLAVSFALSLSAETEPDGRCHAVHGADEKIRGCAKQGVHRLLVAREQAGDLAAYGHRTGVKILDAETLEEAARLASAPPTAQNGLASPPEIGEAGEGLIPLHSRFYITREVDREFLSAVSQYRSILLVKGPRQVGKSSLLARGMDLAQRQGASVVLTDFQRLSGEDLRSLDSFYLALGRMVARQLGVQTDVRAVWTPGRSANLNFEEYMEDHVLPRVETLVWGMDEVDKLFQAPLFRSDVFGLFRSWANERQGKPTSPWGRVSLILVYATEAHLFLEDVNQSPFNIGTRFELEDFTVHEVAELNERYGSPLSDTVELARLYALVGGHPYLVRRCLYTMVRQGIPIETLERVVDRDSGPLGDHLRRIRILLTKSPENCQALQAILEGRPCPSYEAFYHLRSAGLIVGDALEEAQPRCQVYARYLRRYLL
jgi:hypothetical protein